MPVSSENKYKYFYLPVVVASNKWPTSILTITKIKAQVDGAANVLRFRPSQLEEK